MAFSFLAVGGLGAELLSSDAADSIVIRDPAPPPSPSWVFFVVVSVGWGEKKGKPKKGPLFFVLTLPGGSLAAEVKLEGLILATSRALRPFIPQSEIQVMDGRAGGGRKGAGNGRERGLPTIATDGRGEGRFE